MSADLNADWNPYTSGQTFFSAPDGTTFDNTAALNMYMRGRLGQNRFMGGTDRVAGSGGGGSAPAGSMGGGLGGAYADAMGSARGANESRYNDILGQYQAMTGGKPPAKKNNVAAAKS